MTKQARNGPSEAEYIEIMRQAVNRTDGGYITVQIDAMTAVILVGVMQLALRHPDLPGATQAITASFAIGLQARLVQACGPEIGRLLDYGWDPAYDVKGASDG